MIFFFLCSKILQSPNLTIICPLCVIEPIPSLSLTMLEIPRYGHDKVSASVSSMNVPSIPAFQYAELAVGFIELDCLFLKYSCTDN